MILEIVKKHKVWTLFFLGFCIRLLFLPFAQTTDPDAVSRVFIALFWMDAPYNISEGVWPPIHHYLDAIALYIWPDHVLSPKLLHILFASFSVFPLYNFIGREFNRKGAFWATLLYILSPVVIRYSLMAMTEVCYVYFVLVSMNLLSKAKKEQGNKFLLAFIAGISLTIAAGVRYEAWAMIAFFTFILFLQKEWKIMIVFWCFSMIFPLFWMWGNFQAHDDFLYGVHMAYDWNSTIEGVNDFGISFKEGMRRIFFFPFSLFMFLSPLVSLVLIFILFQSIRKRILTYNQYLWLAPFFILFGMYIYKALTGGLLLHHRYSALLVFMIAPLFSLFFDNQIKFPFSKKIFSAILIALLVPTSFLLSNIDTGPWKDSNFKLSALPKIKNGENIENALNAIKAELHEGQSVILDFINWQETFYLALNIGLSPKNVLILPGGKNEMVDVGKLKSLTKENDGFFLVKSYSRFLEGNCKKQGDLMIVKDLKNPLKLEFVQSWSDLLLYKYRPATGREIELVSDLPVKSWIDKDLGFYKRQILRDPVWLKEVKRKAKERGVTVEEMINLDAEWVLKHESSKE